MVSLHDFANLPKPGNVSICERDGRLCSLPINQVDVSFVGGINLNTYPEIQISRDLFHPTSTAIFGDDRRALLNPINESLLKRVTRLYFEDGLREALSEAANTTNSPNTSPNWITTTAHLMLRIFDFGHRIRVILKPHLKDQGIDSIGKYSLARDWRRSLIRCIKWHPNYFKIAVASSDDSIRVYSKEKNVMPILKSSLQRNIVDMAWRPFTAGEIAVGCQNGIFLWTLDIKTMSNITRPLSQAVHLKHSNHFPVTSLEWNHNGNLLVTCSINDSNILIWDVDQQQNVPLKRVGAPCSHIKWSPNCSMLFTSTVGNIFRVWTTNNWQPERWTIPIGTIQSVCWSPCEEYLLFVTTDDPMLYSLRFSDEQLFTTSTAMKEAIPLANLSKVTINNTIIGGRAQSIAWSPNGRYLAIIFKDSDIIAIFSTTINRHLLSISPDCFLTGNTGEHPVYICFQPLYRNDVTNLLTIGWSSGRIQYFPFL